MGKAYKPNGLNCSYCGEPLMGNERIACQEHRKQAQIDYRIRNKESLYRYSRLWAKANPERMHEYYRRDWEKNKEKKKKYARAYKVRRRAERNQTKILLATAIPTPDPVCFCCKRKFIPRYPGQHFCRRPACVAEENRVFGKLREINIENIARGTIS